MKTTYILSAKRTPVGGLLGNLSHLKATQLGAIAIKGALDGLNLDITNVDSVYFGNVLSAGIGQSPARQAAIGAGIPESADATTINKVCSSGLKAMTIGAQQIQLGLENLVVTGGMESMSNAPHYIQMRRGIKVGNSNLIDGMTLDGLWDPYADYHMGNAAEIANRNYNLSREAQDEFAIASYEKAQQSTNAGKFRSEIIPISISGKTGTTVIDRDEDIDKIIIDKLAKLKPAFEEGGTITAANASNINDAAAAIILGSEGLVQTMGIKPLAKIIAYADAAQAPEWFTTAPALAIQKVLQFAGLSISDIDYFEINEAYASVPLLNARILGIPLHKVNVYGGSVAIGHPIGASGARILTTLTSVLTQEGGRYGLAAICNGGGAATAVIIEASTGSATGK